MTNRLFAVVVAAIAAACVAGVAPLAMADGGVNPSPVVAPNVVPDAAFQQCLNVNYLGQTATAPIISNELTALKGSVMCVGAGIASIEGAQYLTSVSELALSDNPVSDVKPLGKLAGLTKLYLDGTGVTDVSPVSVMMNLQTLSLASTPVSTIAPLEGLPNLATLYLNRSKVQDLTTLARLPKLQSVSLNGVPTTDMTVPGSIAGLDYTISGDIVMSALVGAWVTLPDVASTCVQSSAVMIPCPAPIESTGWQIPDNTVIAAGSPNRVQPLSMGTSVLTWSTYLSKNGARSGENPAGSGSVTLTALSACGSGSTIAFSDITSSQFRSSICWAAQQGLTTGSNAAGTLFSPQSPVTRGSAAAFLYRLAGSPKVTLPSVSPFADVKTTDQFYTSIVWLFQQKITVGSRCGSSLCYLPGSALNRGAMSAMLMRMSGVAGWSAPVQSSFADVQTTDQFYRSITWMASTGVTVGSTVNATLVFQQANPVTRGSMAAFLSRTSTRQLMCTAYPKSIGC